MCAWFWLSLVKFNNKKQSPRIFWMNLPLLIMILQKHLHLGYRIEVSRIVKYFKSLVYIQLLELQTCTKLTKKENSSCSIGTVHIITSFLSQKIVKNRSSHQTFSWKMVFLKILKNLHENIFVRASSLIKWQASSCNFIEKRLW